MCLLAYYSFVTNVLAIKNIKTEYVAIAPLADKMIPITLDNLYNGTVPIHLYDVPYNVRKEPFLKTFCHFPTR